MSDGAEERNAAVAGETPAPRPRMPAPAAALLAFVLLAIVNAGFIATLRGAKRAVRTTHHAFDAGHLLAVGATVAIAVALLARLRLAPRVRLAILAVAGVSLSVAFARDDYAGFASATGGAAAPALLAALVTIAGVSPAALVAVSSRLARRGAAWALGVGALGAALAAANNVVLRADYPGVHLFVALDAASLIAVALAAAPLPRRLERLAAHRRASLALAATLALASPSLVIRPSNAVRAQLARVEGAILVPILARFAWGAQAAAAANVPRELAPWFRDRRLDPPIPPTGRSILPAKPLVILLGIDSLRADLLDRAEAAPHLPNLLALRGRALDFSMARSPGARTITTWSSIFAGRYVSGLRWTGDGNRLSIREDRQKRFSDFLREGGVQTITFVSYGALGKDGLAKKFDRVVDVKGRKGQGFALSTDVLPKMLEVLDEPADGPRFLFAHWMDPHFPYDGAGKTSGPAFDRYLSEVALADRSLGELWKALEERDLLSRTVLVVTSDHGEAFGQHDTPYHTVTVYEELIRVPLLVVAPGVAPARVDEPVSLMDLGPTFLDLLGMDTPAAFLGQSLVPFLRGERPKLTRPIGAERHGTRALVLGKHKVIVDQARGRQEIYDLSTDPGELTNLADDMGEEGAKLLGRVTQFFDMHAIDPK